MKKRTKTILGVIIAIVVLWIGLVITDFVRYYDNVAYAKPLITIDTYGSYSCVYYTGIGYSELIELDHTGGRVLSTDVPYSEEGYPVAGCFMVFGYPIYAWVS